MSNTFIIQDNSKIDTNIAITTNLYSAILPMYNSSNSSIDEPGQIISGYTKTVNNGGYIKLPYISPAGAVNPNATYIHGTVAKHYKTSNIYIFKASHIIQDKTYDAEMVVELVPTTNPGDKLYLCFLLKCYRDYNAEENDIDIVIRNSFEKKMYKHTDFNLQSLLVKNQKKIFYNNCVDSVIIFTKEINIKEYDFSNYSTIPSDLFSVYPNDDAYKIINAQEGFENSKEGFNTLIEGIDNNAGKTAIMTCTPINTGSTTENDQELVVINKDIGSNNPYILSAMVATLVIIFISLFGFPPIFFLLLGSDNLKPDERMLYTILVSFMLILLSLILILTGNKNKQLGNLIVSWFVIGIFVILSIFGIFLHKENLTNINFNLVAFSPFNGLNLMLGKIIDNWNFNLIAFIILVIIIVPIAEVGIKKRKFKKLLGEPEIFVRILYEMVLGFGLSYGCIFILLVCCFINPK